jgi:hypothetical protein
VGVGKGGVGEGVGLLSPSKRYVYEVKTCTSKINEEGEILRKFVVGFLFLVI